MLTSPSNSKPSKPKLLDQLRQKIRTRHYSIRTEQAYMRWVKRFVLFHYMRSQAAWPHKKYCEDD